MEEDESQKTHEPSQRKLEEARKKGDVVKSQDVVSVSIIAVAAMIFVGMGGKIASDIAAYCRIFLERPQEISVADGDIPNLVIDIIYHTGLSVAMLFGAMCVVAIGGHMAQTGVLFTGEKLKPKIDKISPIAGFKRLFGKEALMQFAKTLFKVIVLCVVAYYTLKPFYFQSSNYVAMEPRALGAVLGEIFKALSNKLILVLVLFAVADYFMQRMNFMNRNKMSKQELKDEHRQTEGDPMVAAKIKQIRYQKAKQRMMQNVPKATVIITNPTHYAVALRYVSGETPAPICLAKGVDKVALNIRELANKNDIPIIEDPPLARALFKDAEINEPIPVDFYQAVAKIIGNILSLAAKRKSNQNQSRIAPPNLINSQLNNGLTP